MNNADLERFWSKVDKRGKDECWNWTASKNDGGYGKVWMGSKIVRAHRVAYELVKGKIPDGLQIDHLCRNRACCNPDHLEAVTQKVNLLRGKGWAARHSRVTHCPKGHPYDEENTCVSNGKRLCRTCAREKIRYRRAQARLCLNK